MPKKSLNPSKKAKKRYQAFTGREPGTAASRKIKTPSELICIAKPEHLTYFSSKLNGGGDGTLQGFKHRFGAKTRIYTNPEGTFILITGPGLKVTPRGIVG
jgi:hypothetical protein